jgi:hypothetical protein
MEHLNKFLLVAEMPFACGSDFSRDRVAVRCAARLCIEQLQRRNAAIATEVASTK